MQTEIRSATQEDLEALQSIARRTIAIAYGPILGEEKVDAFVLGGEADRYLEESLPECTVILADGQLAGMAVCKVNQIDLMMIDYDRHRQGLGTQLLQFCERRLFQRFDEIRLESFEPNEQANSFYRKNGWTEGESKPDRESGVNKIQFTKYA